MSDNMTDNSFMEVANQPLLQEFISKETHDPWDNTPFQGYVHMDPKQKGHFGELYVELIANKKGFIVERAPTTTAGHDRVINNIRTEIKFSLAQKDKKNNCIKDNTFIINHIAENKDWERLIFVGINSNISDSILIWFTKEDFQEHLKSEKCYIKRQQGGKNGGNDDYICGGKNLISLFEQPFIKKGLDHW
jgi:hypothetical protein